MKLLSSRVVFQALLLSLAAYAQAITVFSDDFDSLAVGEDINTQNGWRSESYDPESQFPAIPTGPRDSISPASGNQMLMIRPSIVKNGYRAILNGNIGSISKPLNGQYRFWSASAKAYVRAVNQEPISFLLSISAGSSAAVYTSKFDLESGTWLGEDRLKSQSGTSNLLYGQWNLFQINVDWQTLMCSTVLNGVVLGSLKFDLPNPGQNERHFGSFAIGTVTNVDLSSKYAYPEGAQPVYADDYLVTTVPEPVTGLCILMAAWMCNRRRK